MASLTQCHLLSHPFLASYVLIYDSQLLAFMARVIHKQALASDKPGFKSALSLAQVDTSSSLVLAWMIGELGKTNGLTLACPMHRSSEDVTILPSFRPQHWVHPPSTSIEAVQEDSAASLPFPGCHLGQTTSTPQPLSLSSVRDD